ncbi:MAG TPA: hypothetical protein VIH30_04485 [Aquirhabdus sp.]
MNGIFGFGLSDREKDVVKRLNKYNRNSMQVVGRGTLIVSIEDVQKSPEYSKLTRKISAFEESSSEASAQ